MAHPIVPQFTAPFTRKIVPVWEKHGRRRRLLGFHASLNDDLLLVPGSLTTPRLFDRTSEAEHALDDAALDLIAELATSADLQALPFEPTARELAEMRAACEREDAWLSI